MAPSLTRTALLIVMLLAGLAARADAHELVKQTVIRAYVRPQADELDVLLRLPLTLLADMELPRRGAGFLDLDTINDSLSAAATVAAEQFRLFEEDTVIESSQAYSRISLPSDDSFRDFPSALSHIRGPPLAVETEVFWNQGFFDLQLNFPIRSDASRFAVEILIAPGLRDRLLTNLTFLPAGKESREFVLEGGAGRVFLDPRWYQAVWFFGRTGFLHIIEGIDHLLFLVLLIIPLRTVRSLLIVVTSFTVAHSITLVLAATGIVPAGQWFPPLIEALIAATIIYMAIENLLATPPRGRGVITFVFGLVHGFGFSFALRESLQLAGEHHVVSLFAFNIGVEVGQIAVLVLVVPLINFACAKLDARIVSLVISLLVAHIAWHWLTERWDVLMAANVPDLRELSITSMSRLILGGLLLGGAAWIYARRSVAPSDD